MVTSDVPDHANTGAIPSKIIGDTLELKGRQKKQAAEQEQTPFKCLSIKRWHDRRKTMTHKEVEPIYQEFLRKVGW